MTRFDVSTKVRVVYHPNSKFLGRTGKVIDIKTNFPAVHTAGVPASGELPTNGAQIVYEVSLDEPAFGSGPLHDVRETWLESIE